MIDQVLTFLKAELNDLLEQSGEREKVDFIDSSKDPPAFSSPLSLFLVGFEEETQLRPADRFVHTNDNGQKQAAMPPLRLILNVMFAAKPTSGSAYSTCARHLSEVLKFFQANPLFTPVLFPKMKDADLGGIRLVVEFKPLTYAQQNEIWSSLKCAYLPSVCYRVKMIVYQAEPTVLEGEIETTTLTLRQS